MSGVTWGGDVSAIPSKGRSAISAEDVFDTSFPMSWPVSPIPSGPEAYRRNNAPPLPPEFSEGSSHPSAAFVSTIAAPGTRDELNRKRDGMGKVPNEKSDDVAIGPFFKAPKAFYSSGLAASLRTSDQAVYFALLYRLNNSRQRASNRVTISDKELAAECGVRPRTIRECRTRLREAGVISTSPGRQGKWYTYTLPPLHFGHMNIEDRPQRKRQPRAKYAKRKLEAA